MAVTTGINHVATITPDLDRAKRFYADAFDAPCVWEMAAQPGHPRMAIIDLGGAMLNVFEAPGDEMGGDRRKQGGRGPIDHFAIAVDSLATLESLRQRLVAAGAEIGEIQRLGPE